MASTTLKGVLAGAGFFAQFHADGWRRTPGVHIAAVADVNREKAEAFAKRWEIPAVYGDAGEMLARERPDFLDIVTGPETHRPLVELATQEGVTPITQKPMAPTLGDCEAMVAACERAGVRLFVHENWRWQPWYREMGRIRRAGTLGRVFHVAFRMRNGDGRGPEPYTLQPYFRAMPRFLIFETLVHFLDTFRFLEGDIASVYCRTARINPLIAGEDYAVVQVSFASGAHGLIDANRISGPLPLDPTFGTMFLEGEAALLRMDGEGRLYVTDYGSAERQHLYTIPKTGYRGDSILALHEHFVDCLLNRRPCESEGREYLKTVRAVEAAYESAERNVPVAV